jgi:protein TonB
MKACLQAFWHSSAAKGWTCSVLVHVATLGVLLPLSERQTPQRRVEFGARQSFRVVLTAARPVPQVRRAEVPVEMSVNVSPNRARVAQRRFVFEPSQMPTADEGSVNLRPDSDVPERKFARRESHPRSAESKMLAAASVHPPTKTPSGEVMLAEVAASSAIPSAQTSLPQFVENPPPVYPQVAIARGWEGRVLLRLHISADGRVTHTEVVQSSGHAVLDAAAATAVRNWRATPSRTGRHPVESTVQLPVRFDLP